MRDEGGLARSSGMDMLSVAGRQAFRSAEDGIGFVAGFLVFMLVGVAATTAIYLVAREPAVEPPEAPDLWVLPDNQARALNIIQAPDGVRWADIRVSGCTQHLGTTGAPWLRHPDATISGGDSIQCNSGDSVRLEHIPTGKIIYGPYAFP